MVLIHSPVEHFRDVPHSGGQDCGTVCSSKPPDRNHHTGTGQGSGIEPSCDRSRARGTPTRHATRGTTPSPGSRESFSHPPPRHVSSPRKHPRKRLSGSLHWPTASSRELAPRKRRLRSLQIFTHLRPGYFKWGHDPGRPIPHSPKETCRWLLCMGGSRAERANAGNGQQ